MVRPSDSVGVVFCNTVLGRGHYGGVVNVQLGVFNFSDNEDGKVALDPSIACRLRMDYSCAKELRDALDWVIKRVDDQLESTVKITKGNGAARNMSAEVE